MDNITQQLKASADAGTYTIGAAGLMDFIPSSWGDWAAAVAVVYGVLQILVLLITQYKKLK